MIFKILFIASISQLAFADSTVKKMEEQPAIYNGTSSLESEFLPMGWIGFCTATAVAPNVIITAAHCVSTGQVINFQARADKLTYRGVCTRHPRYNDRTVYNDYAFCKLDKELPKDLQLATLLAVSPEKDEKMLLNGYGAPTVGRHRWGPEKMDTINGQDIVACGSVVLGGGDSGGSLLKWSDDRTGKSGFEIYGINSRAGGGCSYFNRTSHAEFQTFARDYEARHSLKLCGVSANCKNGGEPLPPEPSCWQTYEEFAFCIGTKGIPACLIRLDRLRACVN